MSSDEEYESDEFIKSSNFSKKKNVAQKKRGRPPKKPDLSAKPVKLITPDASEEEDEEEIILQLPLSESDDEESSSDKNLFTMKDESDFASKKTGTNKFIDSISEESTESGGMTSKQLKQELKKQNEMIKRMKEAMANMRKNSFVPPDNSAFVKSRLINMNLFNINKNNEPIVVDKTDVACWWCCHNFNTMPCFIPDRICENKYYVFGCFCGYSCAAAYNSNMNDSRSLDRLSLMKRMCHEIYGTSNIKQAQPREVLLMFGGDVSIEEFRNQSLIHAKEVKVKLPPLIPLLMSVDECAR